MVARTALRTFVKNEAMRNKIAMAYLVVGIGKVLLALAFMLFPDKVSKVPLLGQLSKDNKDHTAAGVVYEYVYLVIGIFAVCIALSLFNVFPDSISNVLQDKRSEYGLFVTLGTILVVFYSLVLFTDVRITKDKRNYEYYRFWGLMGGASLMAIPLAAEGIKKAIPVFKTMSPKLQSAVILGISIVMYAIASVMFVYVNKNNILPGLKPQQKK